MAKIVATYEEAVKQLKRLAKKQKDLGKIANSRALASDAEKLEAWLRSGRRGACPVDLATHGLGVTEAAEVLRPPEAQRVEAATAAVPTEAAVPPVEVEPAAARETIRLAPEVEVGVPETAARPETAPPPPEAEPETPEQKGLRRELAQARRHLEQNELREAVALSRTVRDRAGAVPGLSDEAEDLLSRAQHRLNAELEKALAHAAAARNEGRTDDARAYYRTALELDPDNRDARNALLALDDLIRDRFSKEEQARLRGGLKERYDLQRLGDAIYHAEALDAQGTLTDEFASLLHEARQAYDAIRIAMGEETTMMRFADLSGRKTALDKIRERVALGEKVILDITIGKLRPVHEVMEEADRLHQQASADTAQYEIDMANRLIEVDPAGAKERLEKALEMPFYEGVFEDKKTGRVYTTGHKGILVEKLLEAKDRTARKEGAESLLARADESSDPVRILELVLRAQAAFPYIAGLAERIATARRTAAETLAVEMSAHHRQAEAHFQADTYNDYQKARDEIDKAAAVPAQWPEADKPQILLDLLRTGEEIREKINARETLHREYDTRAEAIRKQVPDPDRREAGRSLYRQLREDPRFADFTDLKVLMSEMDQFSDFGEQLAEAQIARQKGEWERVRKLAEAMKKSGKAGQFAGQVEELFETAVRELDIARALQHLENDEVREANSIISRLIGAATSGTLRDELGARLKAELDKIDQCIADTDQMKPLFDQADRLRSSQSIADRMEALRLYYYVGGELKSEERNPTWPEYRLSLRTADARREARKLEQELRSGYLPPLKKAYDARNKTRPDQESLRVMAERARALRQAGLLQSEDERSVSRWVEVAWGSHEAGAKEAAGDWDAAYLIWRELDDHHPRTPEVETGLSRAASARETVEKVIARAENEFGSAPNEALRTLQDAFTSPPTQGARRLRELRDALFARAEEAWLKTAREEMAKGGAESSAKAVMALMDLQEAEKIVGKPEAQWRSAALLEPLRREARSAAGALAAEADDFLEAASVRLDQSLFMGDTLAKRLQAFIQLFGQELEDYKPRLERQRGEVVERLAKLRQLKAVYDEASGPALWENALRSGNFGILDEFIVQMQRMEGASIREVQQLEQRLAEWKDISAHLSHAVAEVKRAFDQDEDFESAVTTLRRLTVRPDERPGRQPWQELQQADYEKIWRLFGYKLMIADIYDGQDLVGWDQVEQAVRERQRELEAWQAWDKQCARLMNAAREAATSRLGQEVWEAYFTLQSQDDSGYSEVQAALAQAHTTVQTYEAGMPLTHQQQNWEAIQNAVRAALEALSPGAQNDEQPVPVRSKKAKTLHDEGRRRTEIAQGWLAQAETKLAALKIDLQGPGKGMPTPAEFDEAVKQEDWARLDSLLSRARVIGTTDPQQQKAIQVYARLLESKRKSKRRRLFNLG